MFRKLSYQSMQSFIKNFSSIFYMFNECLSVLVCNIQSLRISISVCLIRSSYLGASCVTTRSTAFEKLESLDSFLQWIILYYPENDPRIVLSGIRASTDREILVSLSFRFQLLLLFIDRSASLCFETNKFYFDLFLDLFRINRSLFV